MSMGWVCVSDLWPPTGLLFAPPPCDICMRRESQGAMILTGENRRTRRKACPSATLYTKNPTWTDPGANKGLHRERSETNRLSHGTAVTLNLLLSMLTLLYSYSSFLRRYFYISIAAFPFSVLPETRTNTTCCYEGASSCGCVAVSLTSFMRAWEPSPPPTSVTPLPSKLMIWYVWNNKSNYPDVASMGQINN
jgi:hypothetical protein